jgi:polysaccharide deacetylase 2 family uncharacterized protein YibQ
MAAMPVDGRAAAGSPGTGFLRGWRALIATWIVLGAVLVGGAGWLAWLGPLPVAGEEAAAPPVPEGAEAPTPGLAGAPPAPAAAADSPAAAPGAVTPAAARAPAARPLPVAPEPPARAAAAARAPGQPVHPTAPPDPELLESGPHGPLPRIGPGGRSSIRTYGRPFDRQDPRPRIGLVIGGLGLNAAVTEEAIRRLPGAVTLAFSPYAPRVDLLLDQARAKGMEVLVALPLEPTGYPLNNPGHWALLTSQSEAENADRLDWSLSRFGGYVGAIGAHGPMRGERFALLGDRLAALQAALHGRGLLYVDPRPGAPGPVRAWGRTVDLLVDEPATRGEIALKLEALERLARERGTALGYAGEASPVLVERVAAWAGAVEGRGLVLAPVSALIRAPEPMQPPRPAEAIPAAARGGARMPADAPIR